MHAYGGMKPEVMERIQAAACKYLRHTAGSMKEQGNMALKQAA